MVSNFKKLFVRRVVSVWLILSFVLPTVYMPAFAPRAEAFLGIADVNIESITVIVRDIFKTIGRIIAKKMVDDMVQSTIKWANTGFDGNPAFWTNPGERLGNIASGVVGDYIDKDSKLGFLCSPFQAQIRLSLVEAYTDETARFECTLEEIGVNLENFYDDFNEGGWDAWLKMTQEDGNNPYGSYVNAKLDIDQRLANTLALKQTELNNNQGFVNWRECLAREASVPDEEWKQFKDGYTTRAEFTAKYPNFGFRAAPGECIEEGPTKTPGSVIKTQLDKALSSGLEGLISADDLDSLVSAFASGLLQRYVFGENGLFSDSSVSAPIEEVIDVDGDRIPDGYDTDGDRQLNICHHGLKPRPTSLPPTEPWTPNNDNCIGSKGAANSPFFIPICGITGETVRALESYQIFLDDNQIWEPGAYRSWQNKTLAAHSAVERFVNTLSRYEIRSYDPVVNSFGEYANHLNAMIESLVRAGDIRNGGLPGNDNNGADTTTIRVTTQDNRNRVAYLRTFIDTIGQCNNPNTNALGDIPLPPDSGDTETTPPSGGSSLSCAPAESTVRVGDPAVWLSSSTYPSGTEYRWYGTQVNVATTTSSQNLIMTYGVTGPKQAEIHIAPAGGGYIVRQCVSDITVVNRGGLQ